MKRSRSESDPEEGLERNDKSSAGVDDGDYDVRAKKKRRGQIEKKRRDRINNSLAELRQLVPAAIQKQGSAKLEKAEILQLTVEHLRGLKYGLEINKGLTVTRGSELHTAGFQECIAEVSRCLSAVGHHEGVQGGPDKSEIINRLNWYASKEGVGPATLSVKEGSPSLRFLPQLVTSNTKRETTEDTNGLISTQGQLNKTQNWGLSFALNYPAIFPLRAHGAADIRRSFAHCPDPLMDWTMALVAKTNISAPSRHPWAP